MNESSFVYIAVVHITIICCHCSLEEGGGGMIVSGIARYKEYPTDSINEHNIKEASDMAIAISTVISQQANSLAVLVLYLV